jgi:hypothetical protein
MLLISQPSKAQILNIAGKRVIRLKVALDWESTQHEWVEIKPLFHGPEFALWTLAVITTF